MPHGSETWPGRKENEAAGEMRMIRWMCDIKIKDRIASKDMRQRLGIDGTVLVLQQKNVVV